MKKVLSIILAVLIVASVATVIASAYSTSDEGALKAADAIKAYVEEQQAVDPDFALTTNRYYFLMPDGKTGLKGIDESSEFYGQFAKSWYFEGYTDAGPGIYWWDTPNVPNPDGWVGYIVDGQVEGTNVFYCDVPVDCTTIIWNNGVDGGQDTTQDIYFKAAQSINVPCEYYDAGESPYIDTTDNFDNMIYVVNPDDIQINEFSQKQTCGGYWFYYYGDECFGAVEGGQDDLEANCMNAAHHHGEEPSESEIPSESEVPSESEIPSESENPQPEYILGDADMDKEVTISDATCIQKWCARLITDSQIDLEAADVRGEGVDVVCATTIQKFLVKMTNIDGTRPYDASYAKNPVI